jgi:NTP pyrophosphatase (non-canonical NTP hydrolase)
MAVLTEETGELARVISRRYGDQSWKPTDPRAADNGRAALGEEMADVLWVLLCLANQTGVDLTEELLKSIEKKTRRDALRHIENPKLKA